MGLSLFKKILFILIGFIYFYSLFATMNIFPRILNMYRRKPGTIFLFTVDPLINFGGWLIMSIIILAIMMGLFYYVSKKKKSVDSIEKRTIFEVLKAIFLYASIFKCIEILIISILKILNII